MSSATMAKPEVPKTLERALDPRWLSDALAPISGNRPVTHVAVVEVIKTVATKVRFQVMFGDQAESHHLCLKGLLDADEMTARGGSTMVREADFYRLVAPRVDVRVPECVVQVVDRGDPQAVIIMRDLIETGAHFCSALEPLTSQHAARSLDQLAGLNAAPDLFDVSPLIVRRIDSMARTPHLSAQELQQLLDGPRGEGLPAHVRSGEGLLKGMRDLAMAEEIRPEFLLHGDCHAGNSYLAKDGPGLIDWQMLQRGGWALDAAYHICALLPVDVAEREERTLLRHYLGTMQAKGAVMPSDEDAWLQYRQAVIYGFYLWAITRRVDPPIINVFVNRMGMAVTRHDSFALVAGPGR